MSLGLFDDFENVNAKDPVGAICDAGIDGLLEEDLRRMFGWTAAELVLTVTPLFQVGRVAGHLHGNQYLYYAPEHKGKVLGNIQRRLRRRRDK